MSYQVHVTSVAERDLNRAADHIEFILKNPKAADNLIDEAEKQINSLSEFPKRFQLVDDPVLSSWGIRFIAVNGYLAFYIISEENNTIYIVRFLFQKSDWKSILHQGFAL